MIDIRRRGCSRASSSVSLDVVVSALRESHLLDFLLKLHLAEFVTCPRVLYQKGTTSQSQFILFFPFTNEDGNNLP